MLWSKNCVVVGYKLRLGLTLWAWIFSFFSIHHHSFIFLFLLKKTLMMSNDSFRFNSNWFDVMLMLIFDVILVLFVVVAVVVGDIDEWVFFFSSGKIVHSFVVILIIRWQCEWLCDADDAKNDVNVSPIPKWKSTLCFFKITGTLFFEFVKLIQSNESNECIATARKIKFKLNDCLISI